ncbi:SprT-like domain-containing protein [Belliella sp. R4-6]|uniref:SprT-like domain-containing protein n=1 Tax=Belliella alkalica TaxID=1730871 RepID=A0ABS9V9D9_9BACT|nr:SprT-like domain-containing protein [Belliella alkalica]MCH7413044.1 SprT-like domain-containing protein [Belliella alkalica]
MNTDQQFFQAFRKHVPEDAVKYCFDLWKEMPFNFYITNSRNSKLGDFRYRSDKKVQTITINYDLNPYQFLITYLHEVAHYRAFSKFGGYIKPHGKEWKSSFQKLMEPVLNPKVFPIEIYIHLKRHMANPKASSTRDYFLMIELRKFDKDKKEENLKLLQHLNRGTVFEIKGRVFEKIETKRTRVLCLELKTGKKYLILGHAEVLVK